MSIKNKVITLNAQGFTTDQIVAQTGYSKKQVQQTYIRCGIHANRYTILNQDETLKQFIIGSMLGDGCISEANGLNINSRISFGHCEKQYDYILWKSNFLNRYQLSNNHIGKYVHKSNRYITGQCITYTFKSKTHPYFTNLRNLFYSAKGKKIKVDLVKELGPLGLAIWYMDDGNICTRSYQIATNGFDKEDRNFLIQVLKNNFDINATVDKNGRLYIRVDSKQKFKEIIEPYIIPCMLYKLRQS